MRRAHLVSADRSPRRGRGRPPRALFALLAGLACAGCGELHAIGSGPAPSRALAVALDGQPGALYAPLYAGIADGSFAQGALRVSLTPAGSDAGSLAALQSGRAQVAIASEPAVLAARADGQRVVAIGALETGPLEAIISLRPLRSPRALVGRNIVTDGTPLASAELGSYLASAGLTTADVHLISGNAGTLMQRRAYAMVGRWDLDAVALALAKRHPNVVRVEATGVPTYTDLAVVVRVHEAHYQGALLRAFLQSLGRAEAATRANPTAAAALLVKADAIPGLRFELAALSATEAVSEPPAPDQPFGFQNPVNWQRFGNWMAARGLLRSAAVAGDTITDEFLPGQGE